MIVDTLFYRESTVSIEISNINDSASSTTFHATKDLFAYLPDLLSAD